MSVVSILDGEAPEQEDVDFSGPGCKPFARYVGSKVQLLSTLREHMPKRFSLYAEPFVGGGALFFSTQPRHAVLSDSNLWLIRTYKAIQDDVDGVITALKTYADAHAQHHANGQDEAFYYHVRDNTNPTTMDDVNAAALFVYLNKTNYNGLLRVNKAGKYNVPFGHRKNVTVLDENVLRACSTALQKATIVHRDFRETPAMPPGSFAYFDSPYAPLTATSDFTSYNVTGFTAKDQTDLRDLALHLKRRHVHVLLSNSSAPLIRELYKAPDFEILEVSAKRNVAANVESRASVVELLIR